MTTPDRGDADEITAPATLDEVQAHASHQHAGQSQTSLEREVAAEVPTTPVDTARPDARPPEG